MSGAGVKAFDQCRVCARPVCPAPAHSTTSICIHYETQPAQTERVWPTSCQLGGEQRYRERTWGKNANLCEKNELCCRCHQYQVRKQSVAWIHQRNIYMIIYSKEYHWTMINYRTFVEEGKMLSNKVWQKTQQLTFCSLIILMSIQTTLTFSLTWNTQLVQLFQSF